MTVFASYHINNGFDAKGNLWPEDVPIIWGGDRHGTMQIIGKVEVMEDLSASDGFRLIEVEIFEEGKNTGLGIRPGDVLWPSFEAYCSHPVIVSAIGDEIAKERHARGRRAA